MQLFVISPQTVRCFSHAALFNITPEPLWLLRSVIKTILQFCKENSLPESFAAIQRECQVSLNTVESLEGFVADINAGRWDVVLPAVAQLKLPRNKLEDLYELVRARVHPELVPQPPQLCQGGRRVCSIARRGKPASAYTLLIPLAGGPGLASPKAQAQAALSCPFKDCCTSGLSPVCPATARHAVRFPAQQEPGRLAAAHAHRQR